MLLMPAPEAGGLEFDGVLMVLGGSKEFLIRSRSWPDIGFAVEDNTEDAGPRESNFFSYSSGRRGGVLSRRRIVSSTSGGGGGIMLPRRRIVSSTSGGGGGIMLSRRLKSGGKGELNDAVSCDLRASDNFTEEEGRGGALSRRRIVSSTSGGGGGIMLPRRRIVSSTSGGGGGITLSRRLKLGGSIVSLAGCNLDIETLALATVFSKLPFLEAPCSSDDARGCCVSCAGGSGGASLSSPLLEFPLLGS